jgi:RNA polymerase sigma factor (sigma-70 family)
LKAIVKLAPGTIEQYQRKLQYKARYHLGSFCPDVDDVVQETLLRFLQAHDEGKVRNLNALGAFASGICNNVILEYRRRLWRDPPAEVDERNSTAASPPEAETIERQQSIAAALAQLSERDCAILRAFFLQEKSKSEICEELRLSDGQFRVALFRAKDRFRKVYTQGLKHSAGQGH